MNETVEDLGGVESRGDTVGISVIHKGQTVKYGLLPANGDYFKASDFPRLAEEFPSLTLPYGEPQEYIVSGVNKIALAVQNLVLGSDKAATWSALPRYLNSGAAGALRVARGDGKGVFVVLFDSGFASRSTDNGLTWLPLTQGLNCGSVTAAPYSLETDGAGVWVAGFTNGFASRSTDNGETWSALPQYLNSGGNNQIYSLGTDRLGNWVAGFHNGFASRSTDNGATWAALPSVLSNGSSSIIKILNSISGSPTGVFIALGQGGFASRSTDNGLTWLPLTQGLNNGAVTSTHRGLATNGAGVWVATADGGYSSISTDDGVTWSTLPSHLNAGGAGSQSESVETDKNGVWVATWHDGTASRSIDNGKTWTALSQFLNSGANGNCYLAVSSGDVWIAGFEGGFAAIADGVSNITTYEWGIPA